MDGNYLGNLGLAFFLLELESWEGWRLNMFFILMLMFCISLKAELVIFVEMGKLILASSHLIS